MSLKRACSGIFGLLISVSVTAQNLSFNTAVNIWPGYSSANTVSITNFKGKCYIAFKNIADGITYIGTADERQPQAIKGVSTRSFPLLFSTGDNLYLLWVTDDGNLGYLAGSNGKVDNAAVHDISLKDKQTFNVGLSATVVGDKVMVASRDQSKSGMIYTILDISADGSLTANTSLKQAPAKSADQPAITALSDSVVRFAWHGVKDLSLYQADLNIRKDSWTRTQQLYKAQSTATPTVYKATAHTNFYIWTGGKKDDKLYYTTEANGKLAAKNSELPAYFTTQAPVSISSVGDNRFVMAYVGTDHLLYLSYFKDYDPARWMEQTLYPAKENYSLRDIVIPGSHDAGMSVLTATGGQQAGTINECNTLTQDKNFGQQLNAGLRMFDLRVGHFNKLLYTKHCSSDCMADAIGGGYGEKLSRIIYSLRDFLSQNKKETVILTLSHFCEKEAPAAEVAKFITDSLGREFLFMADNKKLGDVPLKEVAGKAIIVFEQYASADKLIDSCSIAASSNCFINFKREYAATNAPPNLLSKEKAFFSGMGNSPLKQNDLVRLDWQLTQNSDEAAMVCNNFQDENLNPLFNGALFLTSVLRDHRSIRDLAVIGNRSVAPSMKDWLADGTINKNNKPNIIYVDMAGSWVTDYCVQLNNQPIYQK